MAQKPTLLLEFAESVEPSQLSDLAEALKQVSHNNQVDTDITNRHIRVTGDDALHITAALSSYERMGFDIYQKPVKRSYSAESLDIRIV